MAESCDKNKNLQEFLKVISEGQELEKGFVVRFIVRIHGRFCFH